MSDFEAPVAKTPVVHPPGFRARRGLNWGFIGLMYTSYYMCRYNFPIANASIAKEYGWDNAQMGKIISVTMLAYGLGQIINGLITDRIGGKRAMLIGAAGTIAANVAFGFASLAGTLSTFCVIWGINGYLQAFGAPGMIKMNTAWFDHRERGKFAGIFGFMINLGRFGIVQLGPMLLAGFMLFGMFRVAPLHWRWIFYSPAMICAAVACCLAIFVKETPEEAGFHHMTQASEGAAPSAPGGQPGAAPVESTRAAFLVVLIAVVSNPAIWLTAGAYFCTGVVRQSVDQWFPKYFQSVHNLSLKSDAFWWTGMLIPFVASAGSLISGYLSDVVFKSKRAPVAAICYTIEMCVLLSAALLCSPQHAYVTVVFFVAVSFTVNSTHSLLGTAAAMDIGGRKMAGFASGLIDSFQYFGGTLAGWVLGYMIDTYGWGSYFYFMAPWALLGALFMASTWFLPASRRAREQAQSAKARAAA